MDLSLVMPAFEAEAFIADSVARVREFLGADPARFGTFEIIVVDDGSRDGTARAVAERFPDVVVIRLPRNRGKGAAVRRGMLAATGTRRIFLDCDLPYRLDVLGDVLERLRSGSSVCIGARDLEGSTLHVERRLLRRLGSAVFTLLVSQIVLRGYRDTQCGVKGFGAEAAQLLFRRSVVDSFAFDVEILYLADKHGLEISRVPVRFVHDAPSSIRLFRDSSRMFLDLLRLPLRYHWQRVRGSGPERLPDA